MSAEAIATSLRAARLELGEVPDAPVQVRDALKRIADCIAWADALPEAPQTPIDASTDATDQALRAYVAFGAEVGGTCLGLAMSTDHPDPDGALLGLFRRSQELASSTSAILTTKVSAS